MFTSTVYAVDSIKDLKCEYMINPIAIDTAKPRLSWILTSNDSNRRGLKQTAYQVLVSSSLSTLNKDKGDLWDTGKHPSDQSIQIEYDGSALRAETDYFWKVRIWNENNVASAWSAPAQWKMGLLTSADWDAATWIRHSDGSSQVSPLLRNEFRASKTVKSAYAYVCGLGYYEMYLNGSKVGDHVLDPAQTNYDKYSYYVTYDIKDYLNQGDNCVGVTLGGGFYDQDTAFKGLVYDQPGVIVKLKITYTDGSSQTVVSDKSWRTALGPIQRSNIYTGENYDARQEKPGWTLASYNDSSWASAVETPALSPKLYAQKLPPIKKHYTLKTQKKTNPTGDVYIYDFGKNIAGIARLKVTASRGTKITLRFAEWLYPDGTLDPRSTQGGAHKFVQTDTYICKSSNEEIWEPKFTCHGFRYVEVTGLTNPPDDLLEVVTVNTAVEDISTFTCSNPDFNEFHEVSDRTFLGNLRSIIEDCPHRERCGWLGDAHATSEAAIYNFDMAQFYTKFVDDMNSSQDPKGGVPNIVPGLRGGVGSPVWAMAYVLIPWDVYIHYNDRRIIEDNYADMKRLVDFIISRYAKDHIITHGHHDIGVPSPDKRSPDGKLPRGLVHTPYYYQVVKLLSGMADILGKSDDVLTYRKLAANIRAAYNNEFYDRANKTYNDKHQTANALALAFNLADDPQAVAQSLKGVVDYKDGHYNTGIFGERILYAMLCDYGYEQTAYTMLTKTSFPSYNYYIDNGATTWMERPYESDFGQKKSGNHQEHVGFDAWFYYGILGINRPSKDAPGYKEIVFKPQLTKQLSSASGSHRSPYGKISSSWTANTDFVWDITVPFNTTATVYVPAVSSSNVTETGRGGVTYLGMDGNYAKYRIESGNYHFVSKAYKAR